MRRLPVREAVMREIAEQENGTGLVETGLVERIDVALHGLCQPLTVLQCRLAMGELIGDPDAMREAIREGLQECARMNQTVGTMRAMLQQVMVDTDDERIR
jgi:hypothetical protein